MPPNPAHNSPNMAQLWPSMARFRPTRRASSKPAQASTSSKRALVRSKSVQTSAKPKPKLRRSHTSVRRNRLNIGRHRCDVPRRQPNICRRLLHLSEVAWHASNEVRWTSHTASHGKQKQHCRRQRSQPFIGVDLESIWRQLGSTLDRSRVETWPIRRRSGDDLGTIQGRVGTELRSIWGVELGSITSISFDLGSTRGWSRAACGLMWGRLLDGVRSIWGRRRICLLPMWGRFRICLVSICGRSVLDPGSGDVAGSDSGSVAGSELGSL